MLKEIELNQIQITDPFWKSMQSKIKQTTLPYQFEVLNDQVNVNVEAERKDDNLPSGKSHAIENLKIAAGLSVDDHFGWVFQDTDVYKWIESVAYFLMFDRDDALENKVDEVVSLIEKAQLADGYINTYYQCRAPERRYRELYCSHELYCAGHLIEAAIAYDKATGKNKLLHVAEKFVTNIQATFGLDDNQLQIADGHQEIELALVKLYEHTGNKNHLKLAEFFLSIRGEDVDAYQKEVDQLFDEGKIGHRTIINPYYHQAHQKPENQKEAVGHAVRLLYMTIGMAKVIQHDFSSTMYEACLSIWENIVSRRMYVTGGVGSTVHGEAFTGDYDLPNDTMYCETCASIALINFALELFKLEPKREYLEVIEKALYNTIIASVSIDGKQFFYVNPLETEPIACHHNPGKGHVKLNRPDWLGCACCPPNFTRTMGALGKFITTYDEAIIYINLLIAAKIQYPSGILELKEVTQSESYQLTYHGKDMIIKLVAPQWFENVEVVVSEGEYLGENNGFFVFQTNQGKLSASLTGMSPVFALEANPKVSADSHKIAIQKGPYIYCAESKDNEDALQRYLICRRNLTDEQENMGVINDEFSFMKISAKKINHWVNNDLYRRVENTPQYESTNLTMIPYHLWGNRGENEMRIWFNYFDK